MRKDALAIVEQSGIERSKAESIWVHFEPFIDAANEAAEKVSGLEITSVKQKDEMKLARETRLELRKIRVDAKRVHDKLKEESLKEGRFIDSVNRLISDATTPIEAALKEKEEFAERQEAARLEALSAQRAAEIEALGVDPTPYPLGQMTDEAYLLLVDNFRIAKQAREDAARRASEEQAAREAAEAEERARIEREAAEERARIEAENARLRAEAEKRERQIDEQRAKAEAEIAAERAKAEAERRARDEAEKREREAREAAQRAEQEKQREAIRKAEAEASQARQELEEKRRSEERARQEEEARAEEKRLAEEAERQRLSQASDKEKLERYLSAVMDLAVPDVESSAAKGVISLVRSCLQMAVAKVEQLDGAEKKGAA